MLFIIRDAEAGNVIEELDSLVEAQKTVAEYYATDKEEGTYTEGFYELCVRLMNGEDVPIEEFEGFYSVELVEYEKPYGTSIIAEGWTRFESANKLEAYAEAYKLYDNSTHYGMGVIVHHYSKNWDESYGYFDEVESEEFARV